VEIIRVYGLRFKIELSFKQALHVIGAYAYHFWMAAYHRPMQLGLIAQGLLQILSATVPQRIWRSFGSWIRTIRPGPAPSEQVAAIALRNTLPDFLADPDTASIFAKLLRLQGCAGVKSLRAGRRSSPTGGCRSWRSATPAALLLRLLVGSFLAGRTGRVLPTARGRSIPVAVGEDLGLRRQGKDHGLLAQGENGLGLFCGQLRAKALYPLWLRPKAALGPLPFAGFPFCRGRDSNPSDLS
jgi:hypothetical protein